MGHHQRREPQLVPQAQQERQDLPRTDASSEATGSSATISSGSSTRAPAITTRWR